MVDIKNLFLGSIVTGVTFFGLGMLKKRFIDNKDELDEIEDDDD